MAKSVDYRGRGARTARRDEGAYYWYVTEEQRSRPGCIGRENDRLSHSRALTERARSARPSVVAVREKSPLWLQSACASSDPIPGSSVAPLTPEKPGRDTASSTAARASRSATSLTRSRDVKSALALWAPLPLAHRAGRRPALG